MTWSIGMNPATRCAFVEFGQSALRNTRRTLRLIALTLLTALPLASWASAGDDSPTALTQQMHANGQRYGIAGQALMVTHNGKTLFRGADGEADVDTHERITVDHIFPMHSVSKLLVSTLIMQLIEHGQLELDAPASRYLIDLPASWRGITIRQFLNHTSGVPEYFDNISAQTVFPATRQAMMSSLASKPLLFSPGTAIRYTQTNYVVLTALLEAHYGKPYPQIVQQRIFEKLKMKHTWLGLAALPEKRVAKAYSGSNGQLKKLDDALWPAYGYGHTGLHSTVEDLTLFMQAMSRGELVGKASLQGFWQPQHLANGERIWPATGWDLGESGSYSEVGHDGGTHVRLRILFNGTLDGDVYTIAYLTNGSARNVWSGTLVDSVMARIAPEKFPAEAAAESLRAFAFATPKDDTATAAEVRSVRAIYPTDDAALQRAIVDTANSLRENFDAKVAVPVFELDTVIFPRSRNAWENLAKAYDAAGDKEKARSFRDKARGLKE